MKKILILTMLALNYYVYINSAVTCDDLTLCQRTLWISCFSQKELDLPCASTVDCFKKIYQTTDRFNKIVKCGGDAGTCRDQVCIKTTCDKLADCANKIQ